MTNLINGFTPQPLAEGLSFTTDYTKVGASAFVTDKNNQQYQGTVANTQATISKLPVTSEEFMYHIHVPGHLKLADHLQFLNQMEKRFEQRKMDWLLQF